MGDKKELYIKKLRENIYLMDEAHESSAYLIIGEERAALIDTMNGYNDLKKATLELTDKPLVVINTHGHPDHIFGNVYFDSVYMNPVDIELSQIFMKDASCTELLKAQKKDSFPPFEPIGEGDVIDLGGKTLEVIELPGHTKGSILLLCPEERVLFTGDAINHHLWMQLDHSLSIEKMINNLEKIAYLEEDADFILHGHARDFDDISLISALLQGAKDIRDGKVKNDTPYHWFGGEAMYHPFTTPVGKKFSQEDHGICYAPQNIHEPQGRG